MHFATINFTLDSDKWNEMYIIVSEMERNKIHFVTNSHDTTNAKINETKKRKAKFPCNTFRSSSNITHAQCNLDRLKVFHFVFSFVFGFSNFRLFFSVLFLLLCLALPRRKAFILVENNFLSLFLLLLSFSYFFCRTSFLLLKMRISMSSRVRTTSEREN